jgi:iron(III) transport system permease protein
MLAFAAATAIVVVLPVVSVASSFLRGFGPAIGHLAETILPGVLGNTAGLVVGVGLGTALVGVVTAWLVTMYRFPGHAALQWLLLLPMAMPAYIIAYAYADALAFAGPVQSKLRTAFGWNRGDYWFPAIDSIGSAAVLFTLVLYPYVYFLARTAFLEQSLAIIDVARTLGHRSWSRFMNVGVPLARPAIAGGVALALMEMLADFGTVDYLGIATFTTTIYRTWFGMGDTIAASQLATGLLLFVAALIWFERRARYEAGYMRSARKAHPIAPEHLTGLPALAATLACALPIMLGFVIPVLFLVRLHLGEGDPLFGARFLRLAWNSLSLAALSATLITAVAFVIAYGLRTTRGGRTTSLLRLATLGYALPGTVIAVGVLGPLGALDGAINTIVRNLGATPPGLVFSGTIAALVFAYLVRFLAIGTNAIDAGYQQIPRQMDDVARSLGETSMGVLRRIHLPQLHRSMMTAFVLIFVDVLKELPATLIVRPFNFDTLAVRVYQLAADERLAQASTGALVIVVAGLLPVILLTRLQTRRTAGKTVRLAPID